MNKRYYPIYAIIAAALAVIIIRLINLQLINGEALAQKSEQRLLSKTPVLAPRGEILDRNGRPLVVNRIGYAIEMHYVKGRQQEELNRMILRLLSLIGEDGKKPSHAFPLSAEGEFTFGDEAEKALWEEENGILAGAAAADVISFFSQKYKIPEDFPLAERREVIRVRYDMAKSGFSISTPYTVVTDVNTDTITRVKEQGIDIEGVVISTVPIREFVNGNTAAHILGRVGKIYKDEYEQLAGQGYSLNDLLGKQGLEKYLEKELKGIDGVTSVSPDEGFGLGGERAPVQGNNAILTIDLEIQKVTEKALYDIIQSVRAKSGGKIGEGAAADRGAMVVIDVRNGEILAIASYPTFNPQTFNEDFAELNTDPKKPMLNRAIKGIYAPGSTFKMATALAALEYGIITPEEKILDEGIYKFYKSPRPVCWIWKSQGRTHGWVNVSAALEQSCNYFFYDVGRRLTIERLNEFQKRLGLGVRSGIELVEEEAKGRIAGPEERRKTGARWEPGETLQAAIGQNDNAFTPLQLANYVATIVNGGTRYRPHLVRGIRRADDGALLKENLPEAIEKINIKPENLNAVLLGMQNVVEGGTASSAFRDFNIKVGGKTGTAQTPQGADNALFVGYAPYDEPQIAIAAVVENGAHGASIAPAVREVIDAYFNNKSEPESEKVKDRLLM